MASTLESVIGEVSSEVLNKGSCTLSVNMNVFRKGDGGRQFILDYYCTDRKLGTEGLSYEKEDKESNGEVFNGYLGSIVQMIYGKDYDCAVTLSKNSASIRIFK